MHRQDQTISQDVMKRIKQGEVHMKPRLYFTILSLLIGLSVFAAGLVSAYVLSIVFYWVRIESASTAAYGARRNLHETLVAFPWWAVLAAIVLVVMAVVLVRKHGTMYRHRVATVALIVVVLSVCMGLVLYTVGVGGHSGTRHNSVDRTHRGQGLRQGQ